MICGQYGLLPPPLVTKNLDQVLLFFFCVFCGRVQFDTDVTEVCYIEISDDAICQ